MILKNPRAIALIISYVSTLSGFIFDTINYKAINDQFLFYLNIATIPFLVIGIILFFINNKYFDSSAIILIYLLIGNLFATNCYLFVQDKMNWELYYLRDTILTAVFIIISGLLLSKKHAHAINIFYCCSVLILWWFFDNEFIDKNAPFLLVMMTGFTFGVAQFMNKLKASIKLNDELQQIIAKQKEELMLKEKKLMKVQIYNLEEKVENKNKKLISNAMLMAKQLETINEVVKQLRIFSGKLKQKDKKEFNNIIRNLNQQEDNMHWKEFQLHFENVHLGFYRNLKNKFPDLTNGELKLAAFIKLRLSSKEIALITNNTKASVDVARSRLRKKLGLTVSENIINFLEDF